MRARGISYDTGFIRNGGTSRKHFDPEIVRRELGIIRDDLHCTAVRIIGGDPERLDLAAKHAADLGLEVWFSPYPLELTADRMLALFADCAERAERIRQRGGEVVFVAGAELSLMNPGFLPGGTVEERLEGLLGDRDRMPERIATLSAGVNDFLRQTVKVVRERFTGRITYAAIPLERVDWAPFDIVGADLYRSPEVADQFADGVRALVAQGKPVAITEFGSACFRGAGDLGARFMEIAEYDRTTGALLRLNGEYARDEAGQARYLRELLEIFDTAGVDATFVFLFALESHPHRPDGDPRDDLDLASPAIVKVLEGRDGETYPGLAWEPKAAFTAVADYYGG
ncbi:hypothetical protein SAMN05421678_12140 [Actinopolymorpha cephalotaxi]|uniref:Abortive infection protein n=1 Tax=Actinopolymorpha cephalotaxi TaxID=504797 RepID=A0A1I3B0G4_9ACTN|nr:hypothetical protein [Actinopolymorpha cephalotaxi]NYH84287.1 hypothetical protein [Actinopolymorpha cephalotaxi]SFH55141.1 hypothetical protein SAMN05421678_12140 [Actinopolymorpha cephalotaxi]